MYPGLPFVFTGIFFFSLNLLSTTAMEPSTTTNQPPKLIVLSPVLQCKDIKESVAFYEKLGFKIGFQDAEKDYKYVGLTRQGIEIHLQQPDPEYIEDNTAQQPGLRIRVENIEPLYEEFKTKGVKMNELKKQPWGTYEFGLYDPNGAAIHFYEDL